MSPNNTMRGKSTRMTKFKPSSLGGISEGNEGSENKQQQQLSKKKKWATRKQLNLTQMKKREKYKFKTYKPDNKKLPTILEEEEPQNGGKKRKYKSKKSRKSRKSKKSKKRKTCKSKK